jgi:Immunoglobulin I-set domain
VITPLQEVESKISLIVSGESPEILNAFDKVAIHEGDTLSLQCVARGVPRPSIEWLLKDRPVAAAHLFHIETANAEFMETRVVIKKAAKSHEGMYQCIARNNVGTVVKNSQVEICLI